MGLFLTLFYILTAYMGPSTIFGDLAQYHVEVVVAVFALIGSLLASEKPPLLQMSQTYLLAGLGAATFLSLATNGVLRDASAEFFNSLPNLFTFFFIVLNIRTTRHLKMLVAVLMFACLFVTANGYVALISGDTTSKYLLPQSNDAGAIFYRLIGRGFINDPNDLGQVMVALIPCLFFFWKPKNSFSNTVLVLIPTAILIFSVYLTHSRGAMIALLVVIMVAVRRKVGTVTSVAIAATLFAVTMAVGWTGDRGISVEAGSDRMDAWSAGLEMIKQHPVFGVGYGRYTDHYILTAHNTIIVCAAEIGSFGLFIWLLFVVSALWEAITVGTPPTREPTSEQEQMVPAYISGPVMVNRSVITRPGAFASVRTEFTGALAGGAAVLSPGTVPLHLDIVRPEDPEAAAIEEVRRYGRLTLMCMAGFLTAGWFLSRAFQMSLFVYCGIAQVIYQLALQRGIVPARLPMPKLARITLISGVGLLIVVYVAILAQHRMGIR